jgi:hypothetical protein
LLGVIIVKLKSCVAEKLMPVVFRGIFLGIPTFIAKALFTP